MRHNLAAGVLYGLVAFASAQQIDGAGKKTCTVEASGTNATDDAPAILDAFKTCGRRGKVIFEPTTYYVNSVMNVTWLDDVEIDLQGTLLVSRTAGRHNQLPPADVTSAM